MEINFERRVLFNERVSPKKLPKTYQGYRRHIRDIGDMLKSLILVTYVSKRSVSLLNLLRGRNKISSLITSLIRFQFCNPESKPLKLGNVIVTNV